MGTKGMLYKVKRTRKASQLSEERMVFLPAVLFPMVDKRANRNGAGIR